MDATGCRFAVREIDVLAPTTASKNIEDLASKGDFAED